MDDPTVCVTKAQILSYELEAGLLDGSADAPEAGALDDGSAEDGGDAGDTTQAAHAAEGE
jgi:hypothetical protein